MGVLNQAPGSHMQEKPNSSKAVALSSQSSDSPWGGISCLVQEDERLQWSF